MTTNELIPTFLISNGVTIPIIDCGDEGLIHTDDHPFCADLDCPCHGDAALIREYLAEPWRAGLLTTAEAARTLYGLQV